MNILGVSFDYHDAAAALVVDGTVCAAAQEERFSRRKHDAALPKHAIAYCLAEARITAAELDAVAYYEQPLVKFDRIVKASLRQLPSGGWRYFTDSLASWIAEDRFAPRRRLAEHLALPEARIIMKRHHAAHAASAFYCSPFNEAAVVTLDGVGEHETASIGWGDGRGLITLETNQLPHSIGLLYSAFTAYLGFEVNEGEYKLMGMAAYGEPTLYDELMGLVHLLPNGLFRIDQRHFEFLCPTDLPYRPSLSDWLGPARAPDDEFAVSGSDSELIERSRRYADIAASMQKVAETVILHAARVAMRDTNSDNLCLAGGVALNSLANGRIIRELGANLYVHPAAGDSGGAVGAALLHHHALGHPLGGAMTSAYLGPAYDDARIATAIGDAGFEAVDTYDDEASLVQATAALLAENKVIGWYQGRSEWGPRALGHRSIIANPTRAEMQGVVNERIKFREPFRPFAPAVPLDQAEAYFDMPPVTSDCAPEFFMLAVHPVRPAMRSVIPAVTHADGTARVQVVSESSNPLFCRLLYEFGAITGVPVLMNTSFNLRGEPVVETPEDALNTFVASGMDNLVMGRHVVHKGLAL